jgi:hypothetical protein
MERKGNINVFIHRHYKGQGIGTALVLEADRLWGPISVGQQKFTPEGAAWVNHLLEKENRG